jgi:two-component system chemotaxis sensor kinase CheA
MDMSSYRGLFLSETREHINNLNKLVVKLEKEPGDSETIDALFREAHSIKGMAATMGFDSTAQLSHHLEDLLDGFRATGHVPSETIDYLLSGIDLLEGLLDDLEADRTERSIADFIAQGPAEETPEEAPEETVLVAEAITEEEEQEEGLLVAVAIEDEEGAVAADEEPSRQEAEDQPDAEETSPEEDTEELSGEPDTFQVLVDLAENTPAASARGMLILRELEKSGELKTSKPDMAALREGAPCQQINAWLCTSLSKPHIEEALRKISGVEKVQFIDDRRQEDRRSRGEEVRTIRVRTDLLDQFVNLTGELITHRHMLNVAAEGRDWYDLNQTLGQAGRLIDDLHHHVLQARLMPLENITGRLPRTVRDLSRKSDKKVAFHLKGADVGIDRAILEELTDPLVHLVRNAVDHGIDKEGNVTVSARREKDLVMVEVADDGKGMSANKLRQRAVDRGLMTKPQAEALSDRDALMLVCQPGFSTAEEITETSGRGVGMDVVKAAVTNLGGSLDIVSAPGKGTRFQMRLPLSVSIIKVLLVSCSGNPIAIPVTRVQRTLDLPTEEIQSSGHQRVFRLEEEVINLYTLTEALSLPKVEAGDTTWVVITEVQGRRIGLQVDRFLGQREAFVKSLGFPLNLLTGLSGATVEGDGRVVFIVDPQALLETHQIFTTD